MNLEGVTRVCSKCKVEKTLLTDFHKDTKDKFGRHQWCKPCRIAHNSPKFRAWVRKNRARNRASQARYRAKMKALKAKKALHESV